LRNEKAIKRAIQLAKGIDVPVFPTSSDNLTVERFITRPDAYNEWDYVLENANGRLDYLTRVRNFGS